MCEWWAVACEYRLLNRCIAGAMNLFAWDVNFSCVRANIARMLLRSALPQGRVSLCQKDSQQVQILMKVIIDGSSCWMNNILKWASLECQRFSSLHLGQFIFWLVEDTHLSDIGTLHWQSQQRHATCRILKVSINGASTVIVHAYLVIEASRGSSCS